MTPFAIFFLAISLILSSPAVVGMDSDCAMPDTTVIWTAPRLPKAGEPLRIMAVSTAGALAGLSVEDPEGHSVPAETVARGGPPWSLSAVTAPLQRGRYLIRTRHRDGTGACRPLELDAVSQAPHRWDIAAEAFYSAWIEQLFDAPLEESLAFPSLEPVLRDSQRNFLHDYLGNREDKGLPATPDCADLPYFLRAYFAWKMGFPVAYRACSRGSAKAPPRCGAATVHDAFTRGPVSAAGFRAFARTLADAVHSGSARAALNDENTDYYPLPLRREALWPGTVYADPYGHVLVLVRWVAQDAGQPGLLLAVDAQPDNSVSRKRFWEGTFLFANPIASAGPGFKAHRPLGPSNGTWKVIGNRALLDTERAISLEQGDLDADAFYARMEALINPRGLDPRRAYEAMLDALVEQLETRVSSLDNAEGHFRRNPGSVIAMPSGGAIFETTGPWEDYSTPSRDMRLLIAMKVLADLPARIVRHPELYALGGQSPDDVADELAAYHSARLGERRIVYTRSDGSRQTLSIADIFARKTALEVAYNPNDCVESRWGAAPGSSEYASCKRHAPAAQRTAMEQVRAWFRDTRRPSR